MAESPFTQEFQDAVFNDVYPKMMRSAVMVVAAMPGFERDVTWWVQLGLAVALDKPILVLLVEGAVPSSKLLAIADEVVALPDGNIHTEEVHETLTAAIGRIMERLPA